MSLKLLKILMFASKHLMYVFVWQALTIQFLLAAPTNGQALENVRIAVDLKKAKLEEVFRVVEQQTDYVFNYSSTIAHTRDRYTLRFSDITVADLLRIVSRTSNLKFQQINQNISVTEGPKR